MDSIQNLTSASEYIDHYYNELKKELNARGLQVSKVGIIGLLLHILGFTQQDIKQYYDTLFREAFVGTADNYENLIMHGSVYGYFPLLSTPSSAVGNFELDYRAIPASSNNVEMTILIENLEIIINGLKFLLDSKYIFKGSSCQITDSGGKVTYIPFSTANPKVPIIDLIQYDFEIKQFTLPFYSYGSYYSKILELSNGNNDSKISSVEVFIQEETDGEFIKYETRLVDYFTQGDENVVFIKYLPNGKVFLELGSGIHGKHIPNTVVKAIIKYTAGTLGNISQQNLKVTGGRARIFLSSLDTQEQIGAYTIPLNDLVKAEITYADGGTDALEGKDLRTSIINFIRNRNNLISERDFYNLLSEYLADFMLMFKKTHVVDNVIYCFMPFRDEYTIPTKSMSISVLHSLFNPNNLCYIYRPMFVVDGVTYISPFLYELDYNMRYYKGYIAWENSSAYFTEITNHLETDNNTNVENITTLPLTLNVRYYKDNDITKFTVQSYSNMDEWVFYISIPSLNVYDVCLKSISEIAATYDYYNQTLGTGFIFGEMDISIKAYKDSLHILTYNLFDFSIITDISDLLTLKTYEGQYLQDSNDNGSISLYFSENAVVLNVPVMRYDKFLENENYYIQIMANTFGLLSEDKNRMISDDMQIRFTNTDYIPANILKILSKQNLNHDLNLPLHLHIDIVAYKDKVSETGTNTINAEFELKQILSKYLHDVYTGHKTSFYRTQIVDIVHNLIWVKHCNVRVWDDKQREIRDANLELLDQSTIINKLNKLEAISYCPTYIWWDLDNITISILFE